MHETRQVCILYQHNDESMFGPFLSNLLPNDAAWDDDTGRRVIFIS